MMVIRLFIGVVIGLLIGLLFLILLSPDEWLLSDNLPITLRCLVPFAIAGLIGASWSQQTPKHASNVELKSKKGLDAETQPLSDLVGQPKELEVKRGVMGGVLGGVILVALVIIGTMIIVYALGCQNGC